MAFQMENDNLHLIIIKAKGSKSIYTDLSLSIIPCPAFSVIENSFAAL